MIPCDDDGVTLHVRHSRGALGRSKRWGFGDDWGPPATTMIEERHGYAEERHGCAGALQAVGFGAISGRP